MEEEDRTTFPLSKLFTICFPRATAPFTGRDAETHLEMTDFPSKQKTVNSRFDHLTGGLSKPNN